MTPFRELLGSVIWFLSRCVVCAVQIFWYRRGMHEYEQWKPGPGDVATEGLCVTCRLLAIVAADGPLCTACYLERRREVDEDE